MQRYFLAGKFEEQATYKLTGDDFHHAAHVMRMKIGDKCFLTFEDEMAIVAEKEETQKELPFNVTIACGYTKGDKLEWVAQKATELGVFELIGFPSKTSVVKWDEKKLTKKVPRFEKIVKEAAEQSHRQKVPGIQLLSHFNDFTKSLVNYDHILVAYEESAKSGETKSFVKSLQEVKTGESVIIIFGPEGGLSPQEIDIFSKEKAVICGLGPRILRAETAPLYALSAMSYQWELL
jgi:16S rRNA (uracil1498-N3)-methyltransferase